MENVHEPLRLQKYLSGLGISSRREAEKWISEGRVQINGRTVRKLGTRIDPAKDKILVDGKKAIAKSGPEPLYWMCHKPEFVLTAREPDSVRATIYDLPKLRKLSTVLKPVGRLDFKTEGMLLLTNDGDLAHRLMHPRYQIAREYRVCLKSVLSEEMIQKIRKGVWVGDGFVKNIQIHFQRRARGAPGAWYEIQLFEGRNRVVRRVFESLRIEIRRLVRVGYGGVRLPSNMPPGECKPLTRDQVKSLKLQCGLPT